MNSSVKDRLLPPVVGLCLAWLSGGAAAADPPAPAASTATLLIDRVVHFQTAEGADLTLDTGRYAVEPAAGGGLHLRATNGKSTVIPATAATHDEKLAEPRALLVPVGADEQHLVLLLPDGKRLEAIGSASGVRSRGLARSGVVSDVALQSALVIAPATLAEPVAPVAPAAPLPAPPSTAYTGQLLAPPPITVQPSCAERPAAGQPPAAELEPAYGRLSLSTAQGGAVPRPRPSGAQLGWLTVPGAVAIVVERAVAGTNAWTLVATSCANRSLFGLFATAPGSRTSQEWNWFIDTSGGVVPRTTYDYRVTAIGAPGTGGGLAGQVWWNAIQWTAPDPIAPQWITATMTTAGALRVHWRFDSPGNPYMPLQPSNYALSTPPGWVQAAWGTYGRHDDCSGYAGCTADFPNPPSGTHVFTLTALWQVKVNGVMQTVATTQSDMTVVIP